MDLSNTTPIKELLIACADPDRNEGERHAAAERLREGYDLHEEMPVLGYLAGLYAMPRPAVSLILSIMYICGRKRPDDPRPVAKLREYVRRWNAGWNGPPELRTQAFMLLLLLDLEQAEEEAKASWPEMRTLVEAERQFPTVRKPMPGAAYEEATLNLLFH